MLSLIIKGVDGVLEIFGSLLLLLATKEPLGLLLGLAVRNELTEDPRDLVANLIMYLDHTLSPGTKLFLVVYLLIHGLVKVFLVVNLRKETPWAFLTALIIFGLLLLYQICRLIFAFSPLLLGFTILDLIVMFFIWDEFQTRMNAAYHR